MNTKSVVEKKIGCAVSLWTGVGNKLRSGEAKRTIPGGIENEWDWMGEGSLKFGPLSFQT